MSAQERVKQTKTGPEGMKMHKEKSGQEEHRKEEAQKIVDRPGDKSAPDQRPTDEGMKGEKPGLERQEGMKGEKPSPEHRQVGGQKEKPGLEHREGAQKEKPGIEHREGGQKDREGAQKEKPGLERQEGMMKGEKPSPEHRQEGMMKGDKPSPEHRKEGMPSVGDKSGEKVGMERPEGMMKEQRLGEKSKKSEKSKEKPQTGWKSDSCRQCLEDPCKKMELLKSISNCMVSCCTCAEVSRQNHNTICFEACRACSIILHATLPFIFANLPEAECMLKMAQKRLQKCGETCKELTEKGEVGESCCNDCSSLDQKLRDILQI
jgi:hypothetical protein